MNRYHTEESVIFSRILLYKWETVDGLYDLLHCREKKKKYLAEKDSSKTLWEKNIKRFAGKRDMRLTR